MHKLIHLDVIDYITETDNCKREKGDTSIRYLLLRYGSDICLCLVFCLCLFCIFPHKCLDSFDHKDY